MVFWGRDEGSWWCAGIDSAFRALTCGRSGCPPPPFPICPGGGSVSAWPGGSGSSVQIWKDCACGFSFCVVGPVLGWFSFFSVSGKRCSLARVKVRHWRLSLEARVWRCWWLCGLWYFGILCACTAGSKFMRAIWDLSYVPPVVILSFAIPDFAAFGVVFVSSGIGEVASFLSLRFALWFFPP
ncbi:unnamed protein product [Brassica oleracea var. botrytis]